MSPRKPKAKISYVEALAPFLTDWSWRRDRGAPKKSKSEKENTKVRGHIKILEDEAKAQWVWKLIRATKSIPKKDLSTDNDKAWAQVIQATKGLPKTS
jgi:hypothetical protein